MYVGDGVKWDSNLSRYINGIDNTPDLFNIENIGNIKDYQIG